MGKPRFSVILRQRLRMTLILYVIAFIITINKNAAPLRVIRSGAAFV